MFQLNGLKTVSGSSYTNLPSFKVSKFETTIILSTYVLIIYFSFFLCLHVIGMFVSYVESF